MSNTYSNLLAHIIFRTKNSIPLIKNNFQDQLYGYIGGIIRSEDGILLSIGGMPDHVHMLIKYQPTLPISDLMRKVKASSSKWFNGQNFLAARFSWQSEYGVFSVSESQGGAVKKYIASQEEHHKRKSFKEELIELLEAHGIDYDERYL